MVTMSAEKIVPSKDWRERRIAAINRQTNKFNGTRSVAEYYADEHLQICQSKCETKAEYKIWTRENGKV
jgi:hypothetical protein